MNTKNLHSRALVRQEVLPSGPSGGRGVPTVALTIWPSRTATRGRRIGPGTWRSWVDTFIGRPRIVADKTRLPGWSAALFTDDVRRDDLVTAVTALVLDHDGGDAQIADLAKLWAGCVGVVHSTWSSTPAIPRLRVILSFTRDVSPEEHATIWQWAADRSERAGYPVDAAARNAGRLWYYPAHKPGAKYAIRELGGKVLDVDRILGGSAARRAPPLPVVHHHRSRAPAQRQSAPGRIAPASAPARAHKEVGAAARAPIPLTATYFVGEAMRAAGLVWGTRSGGRLLVSCPWRSSHSGGRDGDGSTVVMPPSTREGWGAFVCHHAHCRDRSSVDLLDVLPQSALVAARRICGGGPQRARVIRAFVRRLDARPGGFGIAGLDALDQLVLHLGVGCPPASLKYAAKLDPHTIKVGCEAHAALGSPTTDAEARGLVGRDVQLTIDAHSNVKKISLVPMSPEAP